MKLFLLKRRKNDPAGYDEMRGCIIQAENEKQAREIASKNGRDEDRSIWTSARTVCNELKPGKVSKFILGDYLHG